VVHSYARVQAIDATGPPRIRQVAGSGPTAVMKSAWRDPTDLTPNAARRPREVQGWRVFCAVRRARAHGADISEQHVIAADLLRGKFDLARLGPSTQALSWSPHGLMPSPRSGPTAAALRAAYASEAVGRFFRSLTPEQAELLIAVVLFNIPVARWCALHEPRRNPPKEMAALIAVLDMLVDYLETEVERVIRADAAVVTA
jgi:hypothetical protein